MSFALLLARTLGRTLHELCETMDCAEFSLWTQEYHRNPWGDLRHDLNAAVISQTIADYAGKSRETQATLGEFLLTFEAQKPEIEPDPISHFKTL